MKRNAGILSRLSGRVKIGSLLALIVILLISWLIVESPLFPKSAPPGLQLTDLKSVDQFQTMFNADVDTPRLVLIFSPT